MASNTASNDNSSSDLAMVESEPLSFMHVPGELRNMVYDYVVDDPPLFEQLEHLSTNSERVASVLGLVNANKQIRAELRPYFTRHAKVQVPFRNLNPFLETYYGSDDTDSRPLTVEVLVDLTDIETRFKWDVRPLIRARATTPGLHLSFKRYIDALPDRVAARQPRPDQDPELMEQYAAALTRILNDWYAKATPEQVLTSIQSGIVDKLLFIWENDKVSNCPSRRVLSVRWHVTFKTEDGTLGDTEFANWGKIWWQWHSVPLPHRCLMKIKYFDLEGQGPWCDMCTTYQRGF
jgi:hypothetical protein